MVAGAISEVQKLLARMGQVPGMEAGSRKPAAGSSGESVTGSRVIIIIRIILRRQKESNIVYTIAV